MKILSICTATCIVILPCFVGAAADSARVAYAVAAFETALLGCASFAAMFSTTRR